MKNGSSGPTFDGAKHAHALVGEEAVANCATPEGEPVVIVYTNYRGEVGRRRILPGRIWFGATTWHPDDQWHLDALDLDKGELRSFVLADIHEWHEVTNSVDA